ncbi:glycosyltransferase family 1 protein, partial [Candidatus Falkowbacteria bacterium]
CGCPTIAGGASSLYEIAQNGALTVNPHNITEITSSALELLKNKKLKNLLISRGAAVSHKFNWENSAGKYLDIFNGNI